jgi:hypothetical protein
MQIRFTIFVGCLILGGHLTAQNVGIGISDPTRARLEINGGIGRTVGIFGGETAGVSIQKEFPAVGFNQYFDAAGSKYIGTGYAAVEWFNPSSGALMFDAFPYGAADASATSTRLLTISNYGNIGIGGAATNGQLQLNNTLQNRKIVLYDSYNNDNQYYGFGINGGELRYQVDATAASHKFYAGTGFASSNFLMSIQGNGNVIVGNGAGRLGVNVDFPSQTLAIRQVNGTGIFLQEASVGANFEFRVQYTAQTNYTVLLLRCNGNEIGFFRPTGDYVSYSDKRLKTNITPLSSTLIKLLALNPVSYEMKANNSQHERSIGFIAQEVKELFPELVATNANTDKPGMENLNALNYAGLSVVAIKAIQEQQKIIANQQKQIDELKTAVADLAAKH